jgi:hypothetical protein
VLLREKSRANRLARLARENVSSKRPQARMFGHALNRKGYKLASAVWMGAQPPRAHFPRRLAALFPLSRPVHRTALHQFLSSLPDRSPATLSHVAIEFLRERFPGRSIGVQ